MPALDPLFHPSKLVFVSFAHIPIRPDLIAQNPPAFEIAGRGASQRRGQAIHASEQVRNREHICPELAPTIGIPLLEIGVLEEALEPRIIRARNLRPIPALLLPSLQVVGVAKTQVPIPDRIHLELAPSILVQIVAQPIPIDVLRELDDPMIVDEGIHIDVGGVAPERIFEISTIQRLLEGVEITGQPLLLRRGQRLRFGFHIKEIDASARGKTGLAFFPMILFEDVAAGDVRLGIVLRPQLRDVHPILAPLDLLHQHVDTRVMLLAQHPARTSGKHFDKPGSGRVMTHSVA